MKSNKNKNEINYNKIKNQKLFTDKQNTMRDGFEVRKKPKRTTKEKNKN